MAAPFMSTKELTARWREHPVRRLIVPWECRPSWWVPVVRESDGKLYLTAFFYAVSGRPDEPKLVSRPRYHFTVDPQNGRIVELTDCAFHDFAASVSSDDDVGALTAADLPAQSIESLERKRDEMCEAYDRLLGMAFKPANQLTAQERETTQQFRRTLESMVEPCLRDFYRALNPAFFEWLNEAAGS
jgi:hypothetical protein